MGETFGISDTYKNVDAQTHPLVTLFPAKTLLRLPGGELEFAFCRLIKPLT